MELSLGKSRLAHRGHGRTFCFMNSIIQNFTMARQTVYNYNHKFEYLFKRWTKKWNYGEK